MSNPGPYYIAYLVNNTSEKQTVVHTFAEHFAFVYGILKPTEQWVLLELVGPFGLEADAVKYTVDGYGEPNRWKFNELITIPEHTVLSLANIKKLKGK